VRATVPIPPPVGNAVEDLTDQQLWNAQLLLSLACGRAHSSITRKREQYFCFLQRVLKVEADLRGVPQPTASDRTAQLYKA
jgi:predicted cobalt transporter CbtA